jgi:DNA-binding SARP family transcriptional activator
MLPAMAALSSTRLFLVGGFELWVDDCLVAALQPASQRLLAFLALSPRGVERTFAAAQLWPDSSDAHARANLRSALWRIRRLHEGLVVAAGSRLRLGDSVWVDVRDGMAGDDAGVDDVRQPLQFGSLLTGLLPDWYDEWLCIERERVRQLSLAALEGRARQALSVGDTATAVHAALTAVAMDPLRDSAVRLVVQAHRAEGNEHDARRMLEEYADRMGEPVPALTGVA